MDSNDLNPSAVASTDATITLLFDDIAIETMRSVFGKSPKPLQKKIITHNLMMGPSPSEMPPAPQLVVFPTGWGKSIIRDTIAAAKGSVTFSISPLLSLGADQETKLNTEASQTGGPVVSFHLDEYSSHPKIKYIDTVIRSLTLPCNTTIILFTSPQCLLRPIWRKLYLFCISSGLLTQVVVDEAHLFASFGLSFRSEFYSLQHQVFRPLAVSHCPIRNSDSSTIPGLDHTKAPSALIDITKCPVIFMTASCSISIVQQLQLLTGLYLDQSKHIFWPGPVDMQRRQLSFFADYTTQVFSKFKALALPLLSVNDSSKAILYTNSRWRSETHCDAMRSFLDTGYHGDVVLINGPLNKEEKFFRSRLFTSAPPGSLMLLPALGEPLPVLPPVKPNPERPLPTNDPAFDSFHARVLVATAGATNAGIHDPRIRVVGHDGIPVSPQDLIQPAGRSARYPGANAAHNFFCVFFSLESYEYLVRRIHLPPNSPERDDIATADPTELFPVSAYRAMQLRDLQLVLTLVALPQECLHIALERLSSNPYHDDTNDTTLLPCGTACSHCLGHYTNMFRPLNRSGVTQVFRDLLLGSTATSTNPISPIREPTLTDALVKGVQEYPGARQLLFGPDFTSNRKPAPIDVKKVIILLLAAEIIVPYVIFDDEDSNKLSPIIIARLNYNESLQPAIMVDEYWRNIKTIT